jgi:hypothetical protein
MAAVSLQLDQNLTGAKSQVLRRSCNELVGLMFGQMLREARQGKLARGLTDSPASRMFQGQLDDVLIQSASRGDSGSGVFSAISNGLYRQLAGKMTAAPAGDVQGLATAQERMNVKG